MPHLARRVTIGYTETVIRRSEATLCEVVWGGATVFLTLGPEGGSVRPARIHEIDVRPGATTLALGVAALSATAGVVALLTPVEFDLPSASAGIETAIVAIGLVAAGFLVRCFMHSRLLSDLLPLVAVVMVLLTDFAFATAPALAGVDRPVAGTSARMAMHVFASIVFAAAALAPDKNVARHGGRAVVLAGLAAIGPIAVAEPN